MRRRPLLAAALTAVVVAAAGCSGGEPEAPERSAEERLTAAYKALYAAKTVSLDLTSADVPKTENGVTVATGSGIVDPTEPKFQGTITGTVQGIAATVEVIAVGDDTYLKLFTPDFRPYDLSTLGAPNPATFFNSDTGISSLLLRTGNPTVGARTRVGGEIVTEVSGTLPSPVVADLFSLDDAQGDFRVVYGLTDTDQLRTASLVGGFFGSTESRYTLTLTDYGTPVEITRP